MDRLSPGSRTPCGPLVQPRLCLPLLHLRLSILGLWGAPALLGLWGAPGWYLFTSHV